MTGPRPQQRDRSRQGVLARLRDMPGGSQLVLRAFLGVTFTYAGLQKLANRFFFNAANPGSIQSQLHASIATSPIGALLRPAAHVAVLVGLLIAVAELAVGLGTLLGLFGRIAAAGGMVLSLILFLSVSFNTTPYFYGSDIVFLFAWTPLVIAGSGAWSLDDALARRDADELATATASQGAAALDRRAALRKLGVSAAFGSFAVVTGAMTAAVGRMFSSAAKSTSSTPTLPPSTTQPGATTGGTSSPKGSYIGLATEVPVKGASQFTDPAQGIPAYVVQPSEGSFVAFSAVCTHMGCTVGFYQPELQFRCPCHGSIFSATTGAVLQGPASVPLPRVSIEDSDGKLFVDG
ncbi:MAG: Rieske 2Fe-2S domain-containing protein [Acidimicrobiales bacterium]|jgi:thiosulfate dehydrogenase [quinone] large subunit